MIWDVLSCVVLCWMFWGVVLCLLTLCCGMCGFRLGFEAHTSTHPSPHISIHTLHFLSPFSQNHISISNPQQTPADVAKQNRVGEWKKCVELLEVRGEGGHVWGVGI